MNSVEHLKRLRHGFKDEIPEGMIHSHSPDNRYKVRAAWFQGVLADIETLIENQDIDEPELVQELSVWMHIIEKRNWERRTTREEIDYTNELIDKVLSFLR